MLFDSGIRRGADILSAVALGAQAVLLGRPYIWGLALGGEAGVRDVLLNTLADFDLSAGVERLHLLAQLTPDAAAGGVMWLGPALSRPYMGFSCVDRVIAGANLSRPIGHPPLRGEGIGDQRGARRQSWLPSPRRRGAGGEVCAREYRIAW